MKIGIVETIDSIIYKKYEVIELDGRLFAGVDAFSYPDNKRDLRVLECLLIPSQWRWVERFKIRDPDSGKPKKNENAKYDVIKGTEAIKEIENILAKYETGVLVLNDKKYPYAIPFNHAFYNNKLYLHTGKIGKKLSLIKSNPFVSYVIYGVSEKMPDNVRSCHLPYESILIYGKIRIAEDIEEREEAIKQITDQYGTPYQHGFRDRIHVLVIDIDHVTARTGRFKPSQNRPLYYHKYK